MKQEIDFSDLGYVIASLIKQESHGGACVVPYIDLGGNKRQALVFIAQDHLDNELLFNQFTESVVQWIDAGLLDVPPGFLEWVKQYELSPN